MRTTLVIPVLALLAGCGDPLVFAEVEEPKVCFTMHGQNIPAAPAGLQLDYAVYEGDFPVGEYVQGADQKGATITAQVLGFTITDTSGAADLTGVQKASVVLAPLDAAGNVQPGPELLGYTRPANPPRDHITMSGQSVDIGTYLNNGKLHYKLSASGTMPAQPWTADLDACLYVKVMIDALKAAGSN